MVFLCGLEDGPCQASVAQMGSGLARRAQLDSSSHSPPLRQEPLHRARPARTAHKVQEPCAEAPAHRPAQRLLLKLLSIKCNLIC